MLSATDSIFIGEDINQKSINSEPGINRDDAACAVPGFEHEEMVEDEDLQLEEPNGNEEIHHTSEEIIECSVLYEIPTLEEEEMVDLQSEDAVNRQEYEELEEEPNENDEIHTGESAIEWMVLSEQPILEEDEEMVQTIGLKNEDAETGCVELEDYPNGDEDRQTSDKLAECLLLSGVPTSEETGQDTALQEEDMKIFVELTELEEEQNKSEDACTNHNLKRCDFPILKADSKDLMQGYVLDNCSKISDLNQDITISYILGEEENFELIDKLESDIKNKSLDAMNTDHVEESQNSDSTIYKCVGCGLEADSRNEMFEHIFHRCTEELRREYVLHQSNSLVSDDDDEESKKNDNNETNTNYKCVGCDFRTRCRDIILRHILYCPNKVSHEDARGHSSGMLVISKNEIQYFEIDKPPENKTIIKKDVDKYPRTSQKYKCKYCEYKSGKKNRMNRHIITKHSANQYIHCYECSLCNYKTYKKGNLHNHLSAKHASTQAKNK